MALLYAGIEYKEKRNFIILLPMEYSLIHAYSVSLEYGLILR